MMNNEKIIPDGCNSSKDLQKMIDDFLQSRKDNKKKMNKKCQILYIGGDKVFDRE